MPLERKHPYPRRNVLCLGCSGPFRTPRFSSNALSSAEVLTLLVNIAPARIENQDMWVVRTSRVVLFGTYRQWR
jgi:hypothetical protein